MLVHLFYGGLVLTYLLFSDLIKLTFRPGHLLINESFTTREVSFEYNAEELGYVLTLLANLEESGTGIRHGCTWHCHQRQRSTNIHKPNLCFVAYGRYAHKQGKEEHLCTAAECK